MIFPLQKLGEWLRRNIRLGLLKDTRGAEMVEFVVSLPLIIVTVVGVFDFGSAFEVRHKLSNAALQGARVASNQPTTDLSDASGSCSAPASICALRDVIDSTLVESRLNDCGLASANAAPAGTLSWKFTANSAPCPGTLTLTINRGFTYDTTLPSPPFNSGNYRIEGTKVTLSYPYKWEFNKVIGFVAPGAAYASTSQITSVAVMQNLN